MVILFKDLFLTDTFYWGNYSVITLPSHTHSVLGTGTETCGFSFQASFTRRSDQKWTLAFSVSKSVAPRSLKSCLPSGGCREAAHSTFKIPCLGRPLEAAPNLDTAKSRRHFCFGSWSCVLSASAHMLSTANLSTDNHPHDFHLARCFTLLSSLYKKCVSLTKQWRNFFLAVFGC